jgi:hypothetical protein
MNKRQREIFHGLLEQPPKHDQHGLGAAYWMGFRNPEMRVDDAGPIVGVAGSEARAAFMAGQSAFRKQSS